MIKIKNPTGKLKGTSLSAQLFRLSVAILMAGSLIACAAAPTKSAGEETVERVEFKTGMAEAADMYNSRNYPGAIREFDNVIRDDASSANSRRLAHLGKSLVYLGPDVNWHSVDNAKLSLMSAGQVAPESTEEFSVETDLLMDAVSVVIGTESKYAVMAAKSSGSGSEVNELKRELDMVKAERDELVVEQKVLNEAIEKLKALTLGN
jgi:transcriptional regulator with GAF, ATPase, and Fis domain